MKCNPQSVSPITPNLHKKRLLNLCRRGWWWYYQHCFLPPVNGDIECIDIFIIPPILDIQCFWSHQRDCRQNIAREYLRFYRIPMEVSMIEANTWENANTCLFHNESDNDWVVLEKVEAVKPCHHWGTGWVSPHEWLSCHLLWQDHMYWQQPVVSSCQKY